MQYNYVIGRWIKISTEETYNIFLWYDSSYNYCPIIVPDKSFNVVPVEQDDN